MSMTSPAKVKSALPLIVALFLALVVLGLFALGSGAKH